MESLRSTCKAAKAGKHLTTADIAEESGIPFSTVNNFFSTASKAPSVFTAGAICAVLGVSLDLFFGIVPGAAPTSEHGKDDIVEQLKQEELDLMKKALRIYRRIIFGLMALLLIVLCYAIALDVTCGGIGFLRKG